MQALILADAPTNSRPGSYYGMLHGIGRMCDKLTRVGGHGGYGANNYSDAYNGRAANSRPESYVDYNGSNGYNNGHYPYNQHGQRPTRPRHSHHMNSDYGNERSGQHFYPNSAYQRSNDNVTAGSGSANTDQWGNSTDPSSVNSSFDRLQQQQQQQQYQKQEPQRPAETYGFNGLGAGPQIDTFQNQAPPPPAHRQSMNMNGYSNNGLPPVPPSKDAANKRVSLRKPVNSNSNSATPASSSKRTSWFKRRFSKND